MDDSRTIVDADVAGVQVPYRRGYRWTFNIMLGSCALVVRLRDAAGVEGLGEIPLSFHPTVPGPAIELMARSLVERLVLGRPPEPRRFVAEARSFSGWGFYPHLGAAIACGIEIALWDLLGKQTGRHVTDLLGGRVRERMECMWFVYEDTAEAMAAETRRGAEAGFRTFYIKWSSDEAAAFEKAQAVRESLPPDGVLRIDPNESWTRASAIRYLGRMDGWPLEFVEQPLPNVDLRGLAVLRQRAGVAVSTDQATRLPEEVADALAKRAMDVLGMCPAGAGGILRCLEVGAIARASGVPVWLHSNNELGIGEAAILAVACLAENASYAGQTERTHLEFDITRGIALDGPYLTVPFDLPGLGVELDEERFAEARRRYDAGEGNLPVLDSDLPRRYIPAY